MYNFRLEEEGENDGFFIKYYTATEHTMIGLLVSKDIKLVTQINGFVLTKLRVDKEKSIEFLMYLDNNPLEYQVLLYKENEYFGFVLRLIFGNRMVIQPKGSPIYRFNISGLTNNDICIKSGLSVLWLDRVA